MDFLNAEDIINAEFNELVGLGYSPDKAVEILRENPETNHKVLDKMLMEG